MIELSNPEAPALIGKKGSFASHNLWIDEVAGVAYCTQVFPLGQGFRAYDLAANPDDPPKIVDFGARNYHDVYVRDGILYGCVVAANPRLDLLRVSELPATSLQGFVTYPNGATHNVWLSDDSRHAYVTDEMSAGTVRVFDITDTTSILEVGSFPGYPGASVHNVFVKNDTAYVSWYTEGLKAFDATDPLNPFEIGSFDTGPDSSLLTGCWGVYPFFESGVIVTSDTNLGMHLLYYSDEIGTLSGTITDALSGDPIAGAEVTVPGFFNRTATTDALGSYAMELPGGAHSVIVSEGSYLPDSATVVVNDAAVTIHDVALDMGPVGLPGSRETPRVVSLLPPSPNPSRDRFTLTLEIPRAASISVDLFDAGGRHVRTLAAAHYSASRHVLVWDGRDERGRIVRSGTFLARLCAENVTVARKLVLLR